MAIDDLVQTIVREVLRQLQENAAYQQVLLLASRDDSHVAPVLQHLGPNSKVSFWDAADASSIPARTIVPLLSCSQMADLALGRATDPLLQKILDLLLAGTVVEVYEFEYLKFSKTAPEALYRLYESYEEILHDFGLQRVVTEGQNIVRLNKQLITERDVLEAHQQGVSVLRILSDAQLTPLAVDCARERGVKLQKNERRDK